MRTIPLHLIKSIWTWRVKDDIITLLLALFGFCFHLSCWDDGIRMWSVLHFHSCFFSSPTLIGGNWRHCYTFWMRLFNWISVQSKNNKHENPGWVRTKNAWNWFFKTKIEMTTKTQAGLQLIALVYRKYLFWLTRQLYNRVHNLQSNQSPNTFVA